MKTEPPHEKHGKRKAEDNIRVISAELIREPLRRRLLMLGFFDQIDDLLKRAFGRRTSDNDLNRAPQIDGSRQHRVADAFFHRRCFAGQVGFIAGGLPFDDLRVNGNWAPGLISNRIPGRNWLTGISCSRPFSSNSVATLGASLNND